jgi:hypothetical protein
VNRHAQTAAIALSYFILALICGKGFGTESAADISEKRILSKRSKDAIVTLTNASGKLTAGENNLCVLFQSLAKPSSADVQLISVDFRLVVGRIQEQPIRADLNREGVGRYCGRVDLGRQYYIPSTYYVSVHYVNETGRKRTTGVYASVK